MCMNGFYLTPPVNLMAMISSWSTIINGLYLGLCLRDWWHSFLNFGMIIIVIGIQWNWMRPELVFVLLLVGESYLSSIWLIVWCLPEEEIERGERGNSDKSRWARSQLLPNITNGCVMHSNRSTMKSTHSVCVCVCSIIGRSGTPLIVWIQ